MANELVRGSDILLADVIVANTTVETVVFQAVVAPADIELGLITEAWIDGDYSTANAIDTVTFAFKVNGVTYMTQATTAASVTQGQVYFHFMATIRSVGIAGTQVSGLEGGTFTNMKSTKDTVVHTIDTTMPMTITITAQWSAAAAGDTLTVRQGSLKRYRF